MSDPLAPETEAPARRNPLGWVVLGLLFAYLVFGAAKRPSSERPGDRLERYTSRLQTALAAYQAGDSPISHLLTGEDSDEPLRKLERELEPKRRTEPIEAGFWAVIRRHLGEKVVEADLRPLAVDRDYAILAEAQRPGPKAKAEALALVTRLERRGAASKLAADHLRRETGLPLRPAVVSTGRAAVAGLLFLGLVAASGLAWALAIYLGLSGELRDLGPATEVRSAAEADGLALRAALLIATFLALQLGASLLIRLGLDSRAGQVVAFGGMLFAVPIVLRSRPSMADVGLSTRDFARNVGFGLWTFLLEIPVTMIVALVCSLLLRALPQPEHPASTALMNSPDAWTIAATFFGGAIVAPFWEETMFRGLLFPALRGVLRGPVLAALVSSFLFASIHPQGPVLWAALATVALFSCVLAQKTRSLVPSVTMHFAHNATLLTLTVLMSR